MKIGSDCVLTQGLLFSNARGAARDEGKRVETAVGGDRPAVRFGRSKRFAAAIAPVRGLVRAVGTPEMAIAERAIYVVGLGSNLGDRLARLEGGVHGLRGLGQLLRLSFVYETPPLGPAQPDYLNAAAAIDSALSPTELLDGLLAIEQAQGRERRQRWGARTLDLDVLLRPGLVLEDPRLKLPHPELARRAFALMPLLDVLPEARDPRTGIAYVEHLRATDTGGVRKLEATLQARWNAQL